MINQIRNFPGSKDCRTVVLCPIQSEYEDTEHLKEALTYLAQEILNIISRVSSDCNANLFELRNRYYVELITLAGQMISFDDCIYERMIKGDYSLAHSAFSALLGDIEKDELQEASEEEINAVINSFEILDSILKKENYREILDAGILTVNKVNSLLEACTKEKGPVFVYEDSDLANLLNKKVEVIVLDLSKSDAEVHHSLMQLCAVSTFWNMMLNKYYNPDIDIYKQLEFAKSEELRTKDTIKKIMEVIK